MSAFIDASVIVAIVSREPDAEAQAARVTAVGGPIYVSSIALYEAIISIARKKAGGFRTSVAMIEEAQKSVSAFITEIDAVEVAVAGEIAERAILASCRYGRVVGHPARLNMGDCFAYACAKAKGVPLLFKGDDLARTDIAKA